MLLEAHTSHMLVFPLSLPHSLLRLSETSESGALLPLESPLLLPRPAGPREAKELCLGLLPRESHQILYFCQANPTFHLLL